LRGRLLEGATPAEFGDRLPDAARYLLPWLSGGPYLDVCMSQGGIGGVRDLHYVESESAQIAHPELDQAEPWMLVEHLFGGATRGVVA
jgi:hypothetical protein